MDKTQTPPTGGSYIRNEDGSLKKVAGTEPAPPPAAPVKAPIEPAAGETDPAGDAGKSKKGK